VENSLNGISNRFLLPMAIGIPHASGKFVGMTGSKKSVGKCGEDTIVYS